jgi:DUF2975 family protein
MSVAVSPSTKLARLSRTMSVLALIGMAIVPVVVAAAFLYPKFSEALMLNMSHVGMKLTASVPLGDRLLALACEAVSAGLTIWALWSLNRLFANYAQGRVFSAEPIAHLNHVATALFLSVLTDFVMEAPISYFLTRHGPPGHREISLSFGSGDVAWLFIAGTVLVIARVMAEARRMADENAAFV